jgi:alpha-L-fucosidase
MGDGALPPSRSRASTFAEDARTPPRSTTRAPASSPGSSTGRRRAGERVYLFLLMRPYESVSVRGVPIRRVRSVRALGSGRALAYRGRASIADTLANPDPLGELSIRVPEDTLDPLATVLELEITPPAG